MSLIVPKTGTNTNMGVSFSIYCPATDRTTEFITLNIAPGRHALNIVVGDPMFDIVRFHVPGVTGNALIRCAQEDRRIICDCRYIGDQGIIKGNAEVDKLEWAQNAVNITDDGGNTFNGMNLVPGSFTELARTKPQGMNDDDSVRTYADFRFVFQQDSP